MNLPMLALLPAVALVLGGLVMAASLVRTARSAQTMPPSLDAARQHATVVSAASIVFTILAGVASFALPLQGRGGAVAPLVGALAGMATLGLGELTWPRPKAVRRTATLERRGAREVLSKRWLGAAALAGSLACLVIVIGGLLAGPDGRSISGSATAPDGAVVTWTRTPFPGWFFGGPQLIALAVLALAVWGVTHLVVGRPAVEAATQTEDRTLRRASSSRALRLGTSAALATVSEDLLTGGVTRWGQPWAWAPVGLGLASVLVAGAVLITPVPRLTPLPEVEALTAMAKTTPAP